MLPNRRSNNGKSPIDLDWVKSNCDCSGDCWIWLGGKDRKGYGTINVRSGFGRVHLLTCELVGKHRPDGLVADHLCRNTSCCNPEHIEFVTTGENTRRGAALKHVDGKCSKCGSTRLRKRKWGHACSDCLKAYENTPERKAKRAEYERARAATPKRQEQHKRALEKYAEKRRAKAKARVDTVLSQPLLFAEPAKPQSLLEMP